MNKSERTTLPELQEIIRRFIDERDWSKFHNPKDLAISLSLEAAEVLEHFQWKNSDEIAAYIKRGKSEVGDELADVLYWTLLLADKMNIDLVDAFNEKMEKNRNKYPIAKAKGNHKKYTEYGD